MDTPTTHSISLNEAVDMIHQFYGTASDSNTTVTWDDLKTAPAKGRYKTKEKYKTKPKSRIPKNLKGRR